MSTFFTHAQFVAAYGQRFRDVAKRCGKRLDVLVLPTGDERLAAPQLASIELACFIGIWEADPTFTRRFLGSTLQAPNLQWMHLPNAGVDDPVFHKLLAKGVRLTTSSGATAAPIAHTAIGGMLALTRGFPAWGMAQRRHEWTPHRDAPRDLMGQTMVIVGLGAIGNEIARLARGFGLNVIGVRRSARRATDHAEHVVPPSQLQQVAARADWLVLACPLTDETRGMISADVLAALPSGAHVINIARGQVVDEDALLTALRNGHLGGAYLDVFEHEPLPSDSPLWDLPNVILSPHNAASSSGNSARVAEIFFRNLELWWRGEAMENEVDVDTIAKVG